MPPPRRPVGTPDLVLTQPGPLAVDPAGNVYVATGYAPTTILKIAPDGAGTPFAKTRTTSGLAVDDAGNVIAPGRDRVPDGVALSTITRFAPDGGATDLSDRNGNRSADGPAPRATFFCPQGVALDAADNIYVADTGNSLVRQISPAGIMKTVAGCHGVRGIDAGPLPAGLPSSTLT